MNGLVQGAFDSGCPKDFDFEKPFAKVVAFKNGGKWYSTKFVYLKDEHIKIIEKNYGFEIAELIGNKDESVRYLCPLTSWDESCHFIIETFSVEGFCQYMFPSKE